ncbi:hypothetical protein [Nocardioides marmoriginsengisoli]|uniref:hypothetical protein n=1 Tax=Nocardioides marmoriginsengisoli TaxID=661483 RepID=UPI001C83F592|nr:hypothetical protein [Nocardioides marmoriginsengisoli]
MNDVEVRRLAHAINELRPTWPISSLTTFISRNLTNRPFRDVAMALVWVALDCNGAGEYITDTPKRVLESGPWWKAAEMNGTANVRPTPPRREDQCMTCGRHLDACICGERATKTRPADPTTKTAALAECRAAVAGTNQEAGMSKAQEAAYAPIYAAQQLHEHEQRVADEEAGQ